MRLRLGAAVRFTAEGLHGAGGDIVLSLNRAVAGSDILLHPGGYVASI